MVDREKLEASLVARSVFMGNFNCYCEFDTIRQEPAMTESKFVEVVGDILYKMQLAKRDLV